VRKQQQVRERVKELMVLWQGSLAGKPQCANLVHRHRVKQTFTIKFTDIYYITRKIYLLPVVYTISTFMLGSPLDAAP